MALFAIGMLAVAGMFMLQTRGNAFGGGLSVANNLALQRIEQIVNTPTSQLLATYPDGTTEYVTTAGVVGATCTNPPCYSRTVTYPAGGPGGTTSALVTIGWTDHVGAAHKITMSTLKAP